MSNEIKLGDIVVFKTGNRAFEVVGKYIVTDDRLWRVEAIDENDPPTPDRNRKYRLVAVDCPNVILENIPERYVESHSEKLERELEEQRKEALKMNRNEIKQGDKVRVSKDAPKMYMCEDSILPLLECEVLEVETDNARIEPKDPDGYLFKPLIIPTKYLVKVDAEAKEAKFKVNDVVRTVFNETTHITSVLENGNYYLYGMGNEYPEDSLTLIRSYTEPTSPTIKVGDRVRNIESGLIGVVDMIVYGNIVWVYGVDGNRYHWKSDGLELIEPTEQTEAEKKPNHTIKIPVEFDLTDSYWDAYAADLAKEVALKVANKYEDPKIAAEYAVKVAEAVVEGLKGK